MALRIKTETAGCSIYKEYIYYADDAILYVWLDLVRQQIFAQHVVQKMKIQIGNFTPEQSIALPSKQKNIFSPPTLDYGDILYAPAAATTLKTLDTNYHSAINFITPDSCCTHHCELYEKI